MIYDIIIIGAGIAGLYAAYSIQKLSPNTKFLILEKNEKKYIGGRANNERFYGQLIAPGAGIGRRKKDLLLYKLMQELEIPINEFTSSHLYSKLIDPINIKETIDLLKSKYEETNETFKVFAKKILKDKYKNFILSSGYTDYEKEDVHDVLYNYGMDDNTGSLKAFSVPWSKLVLQLAEKIGINKIKFSSNVKNITSSEHYEIETDNKKYSCNKIIMATTITSIRNLLKMPIYKDIEGQPFMRTYGKFTKPSIDIMKEYVKGYTVLPGPLQKIIPINSDDGIYMIAYNDNANTNKLKDYQENTEENRIHYCKLLEKALGIPKKSIKLIGIKVFYWYIGTHYYKPLNKNLYSNRNDFIKKAQHPEDNMLVVGEVVSKNQGWVNGALDSVKIVLTKKWLEDK